MTIDDNDADGDGAPQAGPQVDPKRHVERINQLAAIARTSWLAMLGFFGFIGVALLAVKDQDFFMQTRETQLPLVYIAIPTFSFFVFAPLLGAAIYVYLHIHLLKLWDAIAEAPARVDGAPVGEALNPWIANDFALARRGGGALRRRPLRWIGHVATWAFVWMVGPFVLAAFWWRSMPAHAELLTTALGVGLLAAVYAGWVSWRAVRDWPPDGKPRPPLWRWRRVLGAALLVAAVLVTGWARTEGGAERWAGAAVDLVNAAAWSDFRKRDKKGYLRRCYSRDFGPPGAEAPPLADCFDRWGEELPRDMVQEARIRASGFIPTDDHAGLRLIPAALGDRVDDGWTPLAATDLFGVEMVDVPEAWRTPETARQAFREQWCRREGLEMKVCDHPGTADGPVMAAVQLDRASWCAAHAVAAGADCAAHFTALDARFMAAWTEERDAALANLPGLDLAFRDLRGAKAAGATLIGADLHGAQMERAVLTGARMEGAILAEARMEGAILAEALMERANLAGARLEGAILRAAQLEGADLRKARLEGADLRKARLEGADLREAQLEAADLGGARLEEADLGGARLEEADLSSARMEGADLSSARMEGADLSSADFRGSTWAGAITQGARAQFADFRASQGLTQAQLDGMIGNDGTLLPDRPRGTGGAFHVWSCWETPPQGFDALVERAPRFRHEDSGNLRAQWLCGPGNPRRPVGTPLSVDKPRPAGHPLGPD